MVFVVAVVVGLAVAVVVGAGPVAAALLSVNGSNVRAAHGGPPFFMGCIMQRSKHSLSRYHLTTLNQGLLTPVFLEEVLPGDSFRHATSALIRVSPLVNPVMHPVHAHIHHWFVPSRILWENWEKFITGRDPNLVVPTVVCNMTTATDEQKRLIQALGVGADTATVTLNALPFRAYNLIFNEFYRDQDLSGTLNVPVTDGPDPLSNYQVRYCCWEKDYFTTARPTPQQGSGEVMNISLQGNVPVRGIGKVNQNFPTAGAAVFESTGGATYPFSAGPVDATGADNQFRIQGTAASGFPNIWADLSQAILGSATLSIDEWRKSMAYQKMKEHRNRYGSRYTDMLAYLGITSSDARLQRPEYLGGGKQTISFSEVLSTAETTGAVVGDMAGHGIAALGSRPYKRFFEEHGYVISLLYVRPISLYMNRIPRTFLRRDYEQYWQRELEMMGDQIIQNNEIYGDSGTPTATFGYIPKYDDYRHGESVVAGEFRTISQSWHMARAFTSQPVLNGAFVSCVPTDRIYASTTTDELYSMISHRVVARRLVSKHARN